MTQLNSKLERLLSQRSFSTFCELHNLRDRRPRLRVCPQLFDIRFCVSAQILHYAALLTIAGNEQRSCSELTGFRA
jgi:hypothetical protein